MSTTLERNVYRAALAFSCRDGVTGRTVGDGLEAEVWTADRPAERYRARRSPVSGMLGIGDLPGLWLSLHRVVPAGTRPDWAGSPTQRFFAVITDRSARYLPVSVTEIAPLGAPMPISLSSSPARPSPSGTATIHGRVLATGSGIPLGWAVVSVEVEGTDYRTVADARGMFRLHIPWPEALPQIGGGLASLTWPVEVSVRSRPPALVRSPGSAPDDPPQQTSIDAQPAAALTGGGPQALLVHGQPLVLALTATPA